MKPKRGRPDVPLTIDPQLVAHLDAFQARLSAASQTADVVEALCELVADLGGRIVAPREVDEHVLPVDLTLGAAAPLLVEAESAGLVRLHLEEVLPGAVDLALEAMEELDTASQAAARPRPPAATADGTVRRDLADLLELLATGDRRAAVRWVLDRHADGLPAETLALELLGPAQVVVGERWQHARWGVAEEHRATSITQAALAALAAAEPATDRPVGPPVLVACAEGEWHTLAAELFGHGLAWRGWDVTLLGPSLPTSHLRRLLAEEEPFALAVSCTLAAHLPGALAAIEAARDIGVPCLVGGAALGDDGARAEWLGATGWAPGPVEAARVLASWVLDGVPTAPPVQADRDALRLLADRSDLVVLGVAAVLHRFPPARSYTGEQLLRTREDLGHIVDAVAAAQLVADPRILEEFLGWTVDVLVARQIPVPALVTGLEVLAEVTADDHPFAAELLANALPVVGSRS